MSHLLFVLVCVLWGSSFILMKIAGQNLGPTGIGAWRVVCGAAVLAGIWVAQRKPWPLRWRDTPGLLLVALMGYAVPFVVQPLVITEVQKVARHGSSLGGMLMSPVPLLTILVSIPMLGVWPTRRQLIGVIGGLLCMAVLVKGELAANVRWATLLIGMLTPACYAICYTFAKRRFADVPPLALTCVALVLTIGMLMPIHVVRGDLQVDAHLPMAVLAIAVLGFLGTGLAGYWFYTLIQREGPLFAGMVGFIIPCVALLLGWLHGEELRWWQVAALGGVLVMVAWVQSEPRKVVVPALAND